MTERSQQIIAFLDAAGWGDAARKAVSGDASTRRYERLSDGARKAVLMDAPKSAEAPSEPVGASVQARRALGYNALARLAGGDMTSFAAIATALSQRGFSAPKVLATDLDAGLLLLEDFGDSVFAKVIAAEPAQETPLYEAAVDTLAAIYRSTFSPDMAFGKASWTVRDYDNAALLAETDLCLDWFARDVGQAISPSAREQFYAAWTEAFTALDAHAPGLALRDFHAENLFWLPDRAREGQVGLIDFQDALFVHPAYDLGSLIEDIRRDVDPALVTPLKTRFCAKAGLKYDDQFDAAYAVITAQRATKLLGFPVRADLAFGKPQYRVLLPRVIRHLNTGLAHPRMAEVKAWYKAHLPEALL